MNKILLFSFVFAFLFLVALDASAAIQYDFYATLNWSGIHDYDLYVRTPSGYVYYFASGGAGWCRDAYPACSSSPSPPECVNISNTTTTGTWEVWYNQYSPDCIGGSATATVYVTAISNNVLVNGNLVQAGGSIIFSSQIPCTGIGQGAQPGASGFPITIEEASQCINDEDCEPNPNEATCSGQSDDVIEGISRPTIHGACSNGQCIDVHPQDCNELSHPVEPASFFCSGLYVYQRWIWGYCAEGPMDRSPINEGGGGCYTTSGYKNLYTCNKSDPVDPAEYRCHYTGMGFESWVEQKYKNSRCDIKLADCSDDQSCCTQDVVFWKKVKSCGDEGCFPAEDALRRLRCNGRRIEAPFNCSTCRNGDCLKWPEWRLWALCPPLSTCVEIPFIHCERKIDGGGGGDGGWTWKEKPNICENNRCIESPIINPGFDQCQFDSDCISHKECSNRECVETIGPGTDTCSNNNDCNHAPIAKELTVRPENNCIGLPGCGELSLQWTYEDPDDPPDTEKRFDFQIDGNSDFSSPEVYRTFDNLNNSSGSINIQTIMVVLTPDRPGGDYINYGKSYYWRVRVWDITGLNSGWIPYDPDGDGNPNTFEDPHPFPKPEFIFDPFNPIPGQTVNFTDLSLCFDENMNIYNCKDNANNRYTWTFSVTNSNTVVGDTSYTYNTKGTYTVTLRVCDNVGCCSVTHNVPVGTQGIKPEWREIPPF